VASIRPHRERFEADAKLEAVEEEPDREFIAGPALIFDRQFVGQLFLETGGWSEL
jgi:hypothetical protein